MNKPSSSHSHDQSSSLLASLVPLEFLIGRWEAINQPGEVTGGFVFEPHLLGRVNLRMNYADYPATDKAPGFRHEDLMVIYIDEAQDLRADFYDSEGHVIRYAVRIGPVGQVTFTSQASPNGPCFRLAYRLGEEEILAGTFEIASPGQPEVFSPKNLVASCGGIHGNNPSAIPEMIL